MTLFYSKDKNFFIEKFLKFKIKGFLQNNKEIDLCELKINLSELLNNEKSKVK